MSRYKSKLGATVFFLSTLGVFGVLTSSSSVNAGEEKPCVAKKFNNSEVEKACKTGGQKAAKALMKKWVKQAKAAGQKVVCKDCHKDLKTFDPTPKAGEKLGKLLASLNGGEAKPGAKKPEKKKPAEKKSNPPKKK